MLNKEEERDITKNKKRPSKKIITLVFFLVIGLVLYFYFLTFIPDTRNFLITLAENGFFMEKFTLIILLGIESIIFLLVVFLFRKHIFKKEEYEKDKKKNFLLENKKLIILTFILSIFTFFPLEIANNFSSLWYLVSFYVSSQFVIFSFLFIFSKIKLKFLLIIVRSPYFFIKSLFLPFIFFLSTFLGSLNGYYGFKTTFLVEIEENLIRGLGNYLGNAIYYPFKILYNLGVNNPSFFFWISILGFSLTFLFIFIKEIKDELKKENDESIDIFESLSPFPLDLVEMEEKDITKNKNSEKNLQGGTD